MYSTGVLTGCQIGREESCVLVEAYKCLRCDCTEKKKNLFGSHHHAISHFVTVVVMWPHRFKVQASPWMHRNELFLRLHTVCLVAEPPCSSYLLAQLILRVPTCLCAQHVPLQTWFLHASIIDPFKHCKPSRVCTLHSHQGSTARPPIIAPPPRPLDWGCTACRGVADD